MTAPTQTHGPGKACPANPQPRAASSPHLCFHHRCQHLGLSCLQFSLGTLSLRPTGDPTHPPQLASLAQSRPRELLVLLQILHPPASGLPHRLQGCGLSERFPFRRRHQADQQFWARGRRHRARAFGSAVCPCTSAVPGLQPGRPGPQQQGSQRGPSLLRRPDTGAEALHGSKWTVGVMGGVEEGRGEDRGRRRRERGHKESLRKQRDLISLPSVSPALNWVSGTRQGTAG